MTEPRNVALITPTFPSLEEPDRGVYVLHLARALQRIVPTSVFCITGSIPTAPPLRRSYHPLRKRQSLPDISTRFLTFFSVPWLSRGCAGHLCYRALKSSILRASPDAIIAFWVYPHGYAGIRLATELNIPIIVCAIGSDLKRIPDPITRCMTQWTLRKISHLQTVSDDLRRRAIELGCVPERVHTILNGCDHTLFHLRDRTLARVALGVGQDTELVVFVGWILKSKGVLELADALAQVSKSRPNLRAVFIGDGAGMPALHQRIAAAGLGDKVTLLGRKEPRHVADWLAAANLLCLPSHSEGCPNVVIEALCTGRPVVASAVGGIPELIDSGCGILTPVREPDALAAALQECLATRWDERRIAERYRRTWDDVATDTLNLLNSTPHAQSAIA